MAMARSSTEQRPAARGDRRLSHTRSRHGSVPGAAGPTSGEQARTVAGLNVLAGIWLIIAPFVLGYGDGDPYWNDIVFGAIVAVLGASRGFVAPWARWISAINVLIGAWIFASAFWLDDTGRAAWNDVIVGAIVFVLGIVAWSERGDRTATIDHPAA
jgi:SPW repeat-containing protein